MREIKFRAWESEYEGQMHYSDEEHAAYKDEDGRCSWHIGRAGVHIELWVYSYGPNNPEMHKVVPNQEIMQYTGLKDCNGKEIYEGDICLLENEIPRGDGQYDDEIGEVVWDGNEACFMFRSDTATEYLGHAHPDKVIGNIHENPNLIPTAINATKDNLY